MRPEPTPRLCQTRASESPWFSLTCKTLKETPRSFIINHPSKHQLSSMHQQKIAQHQPHETSDTLRTLNFGQPMSHGCRSGPGLPPRGEAARRAGRPRGLIHRVALLIEVLLDCDSREPGTTGTRTNCMAIAGLHPPTRPNCFSVENHSQDLEGPACTTCCVSCASSASQSMGSSLRRAQGRKGRTMQQFLWETVSASASGLAGLSTLLLCCTSRGNSVASLTCSSSNLGQFQTCLFNTLLQYWVSSLRCLYKKRQHS